MGQGALAIEIRSGDTATRELVRRAGHWQTEWACAAERGLLRVLEGGCSVPVGVETTVEEVTADHRADDNAGSRERGFAEDQLDDLSGRSALLHFSGLLPLSSPLPPYTASSADVRPLLNPRQARIKLLASVTSLDGSTHVLYDAPAQIVSSWRSAEKWGEECARRLRERGASEVLDEINRIRREREEEDIKKASAASENQNGSVVPT